MPTIRELYRYLSTTAQGCLWVVVGLLGILTITTLACSVWGKVKKQDKTTMKSVWTEDAFTVDTISLADSPTAIWYITKDGTANTAVDLSVRYDKAEGVLIVFRRQLQQRQEHGIFIHSKIYAVPDTPEERQGMTEHTYKLYYNPEWRKSETALIEELRAECEKQRIKLYVNSSTNLQGKWKLLAPVSK